MRKSFCFLVLASAMAGAFPLYAALLEELSVNYSFGSRPVPKWENGFLVAYQTVREPSAVFLFDRSGQLVLQTRIEIPNYGEIKIFDVAASPDGRVAISAGASGAGAFVAWLNSSGSIERIIKDPAFPMMRLCFSADGSLWAMGHFLDHSNHRPEDIPDYATLRHYNRDGQLLHSTLPRNSFARRTWEEPDELAKLVALRDRLGIYSRSANEWIEVSMTGEVIGRWKGVNLPDHSDITGVGLLSDQSVYVTAQGPSAVHPRQIGFLGIFSLDKQSGEWKPFNLLNESGKKRPAMIYGADGDRFLIQTGPSTFTWIRP
jgi:hypothetical protein